MGTGFFSLEIIQEAPVKSVKSAETVRFEIPWNFLTVDIYLHFWRLTVKNFRPFDCWRLTPAIETLIWELEIIKQCSSFVLIVNVGFCSNLWNNLDCIEPVGMESGAISDVQISASSNKDDSFAASRARLLVKKSGIRQGGWSPFKDDLNQWLQVDLGRLTTVTRLATQGRDGSDEWVTKYTLQYSVDGVIYHDYRERGETSLKVRWAFLKG